MFIFDFIVDNDLDEGIKGFQLSLEENEKVNSQVNGFNSFGFEKEGFGILLLLFQLICCAINLKTQLSFSC